MFLLLLIIIIIIIIKHATSAPAEFGGEIHNVSRSRARNTQVLLQAQKSPSHRRGMLKGVPRKGYF